MNRVDFAKGYSHPRWQRKRLEMLEQAGFMCDACGSDESILHVHHKSYEKGKEVYEASTPDLEVLCKPCHDRVEAMVKSVRRLAGSMICQQMDPADETPLERMIKVLDYRNEGFAIGDVISFYEKVYGPFIDAIDSSKSNFDSFTREGGRK